MEKHPPDRIVDKAASFSRRLASDFVRATAERLRGDSDQDIFLFLRSFDEILNDHLERFGSAFYDAAVASYVSGAAKVLEPFAFNETPLAGGLPPIGNDPHSLLYPPGSSPEVRFPILDSAVKQIQESVTLSPEAYYSIAASARRNAFTVTANLKEQTIEKMRGVLSDVAGRSMNRTEFLKEVKASLVELPISEAHLEQVFRNNVNGAYSDGGETALADPVVQDGFPYRAYYPIRDDRARPEHLQLEFLGLSGTNVYHRLDPVWALFRPPWDWNCRCGWNPLTIKQAARKGVAVAQQWLETGIEPANQFVKPPPFMPDPKWRRR